MEEEDIVTHVIGKKPLLGKVWKQDPSAATPNNPPAVVGDGKDGKENAPVVERGLCDRYRCYNYGIEYKPGDTVYIESQRPDQPYYICCIQKLKMTKRDSLDVHIKWFYRTNEVPEQVYKLLTDDRHSEHKHFNKDLKRKLMAARPKDIVATSTNDQTTILSMAATLGLDVPKKLDDTMLRQRELFTSDATDIYPVSVLRGKCVVHYCPDIQALRNFAPDKDTFFYTLSYNPETRRLASTGGEIRVGASHQATLPELRAGKKDKENGKGDKNNKSSAGENEDKKDSITFPSKDKNDSGKKNSSSADDTNGMKKDGHKSSSIAAKKDKDGKEIVNGDDEEHEDEDDDSEDEDHRVLEGNSFVLCAMVNLTVSFGE